MNEFPYETFATFRRRFPNGTEVTPAILPYTTELPIRPKSIRILPLAAEISTGPSVVVDTVRFRMNLFLVFHEIATNDCENEKVKTNIL